MIKYQVCFSEYHKVTIEANSQEEAIERVAQQDYNDDQDESELDGDMTAEPLE